MLLQSHALPDQSMASAFHWSVFSASPVREAPLLTLVSGAPGPRRPGCRGTACWPRASGSGTAAPAEAASSGPSSPWTTGRGNTEPAGGGEDDTRSGFGWMCRCTHTGLLAYKQELFDGEYFIKYTYFFKRAVPITHCRRSHTHKQTTPY